MFSAQDDGTVVMTGGSFASTDETVTTQPRQSLTNSSKGQGRTLAARAPFDDTLSERDWKTGMFSCEDGNTSSKKVILFLRWNKVGLIGEYY